MVLILKQWQGNVKNLKLMWVLGGWEVSNVVEQTCMTMFCCLSLVWPVPPMRVIALIETAIWLEDAVKIWECGHYCAVKSKVFCLIQKPCQSGHSRTVSDKWTDSNWVTFWFTGNVVDTVQNSPQAGKGNWQPWVCVLLGLQGKLFRILSNVNPSCPRVFKLLKK